MFLCDAHSSERRFLPNDPGFGVISARNFFTFHQFLRFACSIAPFAAPCVPTMEPPFRNYIISVLSFKERHADALLSQGITNFDDLQDLEEEDVKKICQICRRPGGALPDTKEADKLTKGGTDPGTAIPLMIERRLKMLWYYSQHCLNVSRNVTPSGATLGKLNETWRVKTRHEDEDSEDVPYPSKLTDVNQIREVIENVKFFLLKKRGCRGHPLAYVTRVSATVPSVSADPGPAVPSYDAELVRRGPHSGSTFETDNQSVWSLIRHVTHGGPGWAWVMQHATSRDGRQAYLSLTSHYLGDATQGRIRTHADTILSKTYFDGKSKNFSFEKYCEVLNRAIRDLQETGESVPMDRQVRILLGGIRDTRLHSAVNTILSTPTLRNDFDKAINHMAQVLDMLTAYQKAGTSQHRQVSGVNQGRGRGGRGGRGRGRGGRGGGGGRNNQGGQSSTSISDRYYTPAEWNAMSTEQRAQVRARRNERDRRRGVAAINNNQAPTEPEAPAPSNNNTSNTRSRTNTLGNQATQRS